LKISFLKHQNLFRNYDKESSIRTLYVYIYTTTLKSVTFDNKQLTKTIQKNLFKTNEQLHDFEAKLLAN
jgi:hypothetical protein